MDWNRVEGNWKEVKGQSEMGKLTDDDLTAINGQREQLEGRLQQRYGFAKDQARKDVDTWFSSLTSSLVTDTAARLSAWQRCNVLACTACQWLELSFNRSARRAIGLP